MTYELKAVLDHRQQSARIFVVTRELALLRSLWSGAKVNPWHVQTSEHAWEVLDRIHDAGGLQLLVLDTAYAERDSLHLLRWLGRLPINFPIIVICQPQDANSKTEALRLGADQVLTRPLRENELEATIHRALDSWKRRAELDGSTGIEDDFFLTVSPVMQKVRAQAELLAQADVPALILAEPGSGAATVAHLIHRLSPYSANRFQRINCAALDIQPRDTKKPVEHSGLSRDVETMRTLLDLQQPGTIMLEGIEEMPQAVQVHLLEFLTANKAHGGDIARGKVRVLASARPEIQEAVMQQKLRGDVYSYLSAFTIQVPPLRRRKDEIEVLLRYSMHKMANQFKRVPKDFSRETIEACISYSWPGNIRELEGFVKRYLFADTNGENASAEEIRAHSVPLRPAAPIVAASQSEFSTASLKAMIQDLTCKAEKDAIAAALQKTHWNRKAAARLLRVSYRTLLYKIERYNMYDSAAVGPDTHLPN